MQSSFGSKVWSWIHDFSFLRKHEDHGLPTENCERIVFLWISDSNAFLSWFLRRKIFKQKKPQTQRMKIIRTWEGKEELRYYYVDMRGHGSSFSSSTSRENVREEHVYGNICASKCASKCTSKCTNNGSNKRSRQSKLYNNKWTILPRLLQSHHPSSSFCFGLLDSHDSLYVRLMTCKTWCTKRDDV